MADIFDDAEQDSIIEDTPEVVEPDEVVDEPVERDVPGVNASDTEEVKQQKRYEYWQSVADKRKVELDELTAVRPVAELLKRRPDLLDKIESEFVPQEDRPPVKPAPPVRPESFDPVAAYADPTSESFKYTVAKEKYVNEMLEYNDKLFQFQQRGYQKAQQRQEAESQQRQLIARTRLMAAQKGLKGAEIDEFIDMMLTPGKTNFEHLVDLYKVVKTKQTQKRVPAPQKNQAPPPPLDGGGYDPSKMTTEEMDFSDALLSSSRKLKR